jgi:hypothetical protein
MVIVMLRDEGSPAIFDWQERSALAKSLVFMMVPQDRTV